MPTCRLYLITPSAIDDLAAFGRVLAEALDAGDVAALQIRLKDADDEILTVWQEAMEIPCVAIGGVTAENAGLLARAGADFVAVSSGVWAYPDGPAAAVKAINTAIRPAP